MTLGVMLDQDRVDAMAAAGLWPDRVITDYLDDAIKDRPDQVAIVDHNSTTGRRTTLSYRQLVRLSRRIALGLAANGIERGDVVACQLPNWWQVTAVYLACVRIGAITNVLMPIFRARELSFMLAFAKTKAFVIPREYRGFDYAAMVGEFRADLPDLKAVYVIGGHGPDSFEAALIDRRWEDEMDADRLFAERQSRPNDLVELNYTSGTTGQPKGVLHTSNTLIGGLVPYIERLRMTGRDVIHMASPLAHRTGFIYGVNMPIMLGAKAVYQDIWDAAVAARLIEDERVTFTMASTPFLSDLAGTDAVDRYDTSSLRVFLSAGAPIPRVLVQTAKQRLGAAILSGWGMTENACVTTTHLDDPPEKAFGTDGDALPGMAVRVVDEHGAPLPPGEEGDLQVRGQSNFVGYLNKPDLYNTDADGWFQTGDRARMDGDGYIRITARSKDIIIRGGENVPVVEVEELLYRHPAVQDAAIVGVPDPRLGERGCAFVTFVDGQSFDFQAMVAYLEQHKMAKNYLPERLEVLDEMPRTPSGKIQKFRLREMAQTLAADNGD